MQTYRRTLGLLAIGIAMFTVGCTSCFHRAQYDSLGVDSDSSLHACQRENLAVVLVGGMNPFRDDGRAALVQQIHEAGFATVYSGHVWNLDCFAKDLAEKQKLHPHLKVLVVAYVNDSATSKFVEKLNANGIPTETTMETNTFTAVMAGSLTAKLTEMAMAIPRELPQQRVIQPLNEDAAATPPIDQ